MGQLEKGGAGRPGGGRVGSTRSVLRASQVSSCALRTHRRCPLETPPALLLDQGSRLRSPTVPRSPKPLPGASGRGGVSVGGRLPRSRPAQGQGERDAEGSGELCPRDPTLCPGLCSLPSRPQGAALPHRLSLHAHLTCVCEVWGPERGHASCPLPPVIPCAFHVCAKSGSGVGTGPTPPSLHVHLTSV